MRWKIILGLGALVVAGVVIAIELDASTDIRPATYSIAAFEPVPGVEYEELSDADLDAANPELAEAIRTAVRVDSPAHTSMSQAEMDAAWLTLRPDLAPDQVYEMDFTYEGKAITRGSYST